MLRRRGTLSVVTGNCRRRDRISKQFQVMSMVTSSYPALDSVDRFIRVAGDMAKLPILAMPQYRTAAYDLYQIAQKLLAANEVMARWLNRFLYLISEIQMPDRDSSSLSRITAQQKPVQASGI
jgi:hypothetical protein